jgi:gluconolactonase
MLIFCLALAGLAEPSADIAPLAPRPAAVIDLKTIDGAAAANAVWRATPVHLVQLTGTESSYDLHPRPGTPGFDTSPWSTIPADGLESRRGGGGVSFEWYRLSITLPDAIAGTPTAGARVVIDLRIDDYAEVWVNGQLPYGFGEQGGAVIAGWNASNRLTLTDNAKPGDMFDIAVFAANGPISQVPENKIWVREAHLELFAQPRAIPPETVPTRITRADPGLDAVVAPGASAQRVATGFVFTEGPVWDGSRGELLFSDPNENTIYRWSEASGVGVVLAQSGYAGADIAEYRQPGSNGLTFDAEGRLVINQHGNRRVVRRERDGTLTVLADAYRGMRLNSPNDLVYRSDGALYFTDPPFGLPMAYNDPRKQMPFSGVYRLDRDGLTLLASDLRGPNGIALDHKEANLYVGDWDESHKAVLRYPILHDGSLGTPKTFADLTAEPGEEAIDGVKVDSLGNVFICGPGGLWIYNADGARLGKIELPESPHNIAFGGPDGRTLYMTCHTGIYRIGLFNPGPRP